MTKGLVFALPLVVAGAVLERGLARVATTYTVKRAALDAGADRCEVVILGSSSALDGISPDYLGAPAINLAHASQTLYYDLALMERYAPRLPRLRVVLLALTYVTLENELHDWDERWRQYLYRRTWGIPGSGERFFDAERWSLTAIHGMRVSLGYAARGFAVNLVPEVDARGWSRLPVPDDPRPLDDAAGAAAVAEHAATMHAEHVPANAARLDRLAALLEARHVRLVLVGMPVQPAYLAHLAPEVVAARDGVIDDLRRRRGGVMYLDHVRDPRFVPADFADAVHLDVAGAAKLTRLLDAEALPTAALPGAGSSAMR